jgi:hypothetical protein
LSSNGLYTPLVEHINGLLGEIEAREMDYADLAQALNALENSILARDTGRTLYSIRASYEKYLKSDGGYAALNEFAGGTSEMRETFPEFSEKLTAHDRRMALQGHRDALSEMSELLEGAVKIKNRDTRVSFLREARTRFDGDLDALALIDMLIERL